jgi:hypothetical protein
MRFAKLAAAIADSGLSASVAYAMVAGVGGCVSKVSILSI